MQEESTGIPTSAEWLEGIARETEASFHYDIPRSGRAGAGSSMLWRDHLDLQTRGGIL